MSDVVKLCALVFTFALFGTVHVVVCASLLGRIPTWKAAVALLAPPLAPTFAVQSGRRGLALLWGAAALGYAFFLWRS